SKPEQPSKPVITMVDATNSAAAMTKTGSRSFEVLDFYKSSIQQLVDTRCQLGTEEYCLGAFSQYDMLTSSHKVATGVFGSMRLPVENIIIGGAVNFANKTQLTDNYTANGKRKPGVGGFIRYQQNLNNDGLSVDLSGAFLSQGVTITREKLDNTEAGKGDSNIKGYQATLSAEYSVKLNEHFRIIPTVALTYRSIKRDRYTENRGAEFSATYGEIKERRTDLDLGLNSEVSITSAVSIDTQAGAMVKLGSKRDAFTGKIPYIGSFAQYDKHERNVEPYTSVSVNIAATKNSVVRTSVAWQQTDYYNDAVSVDLSYSYHW
ncbi:autotransporter outer membrane beta-barrel domain-containing protein, partial [Escherichia albertii]|nr:autotransporter outer membrane beta-barrel domain-containing protein [Escherichia albertii]EJQ6145873.1 autotransporter outer membrane beta-barrel domain-containing protein [Escherichia albertii]